MKELCYFFEIGNISKFDYIFKTNDFFEHFYVFGLEVRNVVQNHLDDPVHTYFHWTPSEIYFFKKIALKVNIQFFIKFSSNKYR